MTPTATASEIEVYVPGPLRDYVAGASTVHISAGTVRDALQALKREYPKLYPNICDETGAIRKHVGVFVNSDHIRDLDGLDTPLERRDVLTILPAVSGG